jgi:hypothetical protein
MCHLTWGSMCLTLRISNAIIQKFHHFEARRLEIGQVLVKNFATGLLTFNWHLSGSACLGVPSFNKLHCITNLTYLVYTLLKVLLWKNFYNRRLSQVKPVHRIPTPAIHQQRFTWIMHRRNKSHPPCFILPFVYLKWVLCGVGIIGSHQINGSA